MQGHIISWVPIEYTSRKCLVDSFLAQDYPIKFEEHNEFIYIPVECRKNEIKIQDRQLIENDYAGREFSTNSTLSGGDTPRSKSFNYMFRC